MLSSTNPWDVSTLNANPKLNPYHYPYPNHNLYLILTLTLTVTILNVNINGVTSELDVPRSPDSKGRQGREPLTSA